MPQHINIPNSKVVTLVAVLLLFLYGCQKTPIDTDPLSQPSRPAHFPQAHYQFGDNTYSKEGFLLGRKLFFDPLLSKDNTISCASCHHQQYAFSDAGFALSTGINGLLGTRNSPPMFNLAWQKTFMWDGGIVHIEIMPLAPINNPVEMDQGLNDLLDKLSNHPQYPQLFNKAFGRDSIDSQQFFWALAQYMSNVVSADSKYDQYIKGEATFSAQEQEGLQLFRTHCEDCHSEPLFTNYSYYNNGIDTTFADEGRFRITLDSADLGKFKVPSLRNIEKTYPYMHDGRFLTLEDVIEHYTTAIQPSSTLAPVLAAHQGGIPLSAAEQDAILAFLKTLTDETFLNNPDYSE